MSDQSGVNKMSERTPARFAALEQQIKANPKIGITQLQAGLSVCFLWYGNGWEQVTNEHFFDVNGWIWNPSNESTRVELKRLCDADDWDNANRFFIRYAFTSLTKLERDLIIEFAASDTQGEHHIHFDVAGCIALADEIMRGETSTKRA